MEVDPSCGPEERVKQWVTGSKNLRVFLIGKVGSGKSSLINSLLKPEVAKESSDLVPTAESTPNSGKHYHGSPVCFSEQFTQIHGIQVTLWEFKGMQNPLEPDESAINKVFEKSVTVEADLFVYCISMKFKPQSGDVDTIQGITRTLGACFWKRAVFALTFANDLQLPPSDHYHSIVEYYHERLADWKSFLHSSTRCDGIGLIPVIPTSYRTEALPGYKSGSSWSTEFWNACIIRIHCQALPALLTVNPEPVSSDDLVRSISAIDFGSEQNLLQILPSVDSNCIAYHLIKQIEHLHKVLGMLSRDVSILKERLKENEACSLDSTDGAVCLNMSNLRLLRYTDKNGCHHRVSILPSVMDQWLTIGDLFEIEDPYLKNFKGKSLGDTEECCRNVFQKWMTKGGTKKYPLSWKGVIRLLRDIECTELADKLAQVFL